MPLHLLVFRGGGPAHALGAFGEDLALKQMHSALSRTPQSNYQSIRDRNARAATTRPQAFVCLEEEAKDRCGAGTARLCACGREHRAKSNVRGLKRQRSERRHLARMDLSGVASALQGGQMLSAFPLAGPSHAAAGRGGQRLDRSMPVDFFMYQVHSPWRVGVSSAHRAGGGGCVSKRACYERQQRMPHPRPATAKVWDC